MEFEIGFKGSFQRGSTILLVSSTGAVATGKVIQSETHEGQGRYLLVKLSIPPTEGQSPNGPKAEPTIGKLLDRTGV